MIVKTELKSIFFAVVFIKYVGGGVINFQA